ncbi:diiron oxygenase [Streptomyces sp. NPDC001404]|uniref:diiron oxygenase n=1 Tax=Streptomyces sp. NPDC001404 TaxID=3364571 RepID=UPI003693419B
MSAIGQENPAADRTLPSLTAEYVARWESRSSVRTRPRKTIDFTQEGYFFPEDKQPLLLAEEVASLGRAGKEEILVQSFYKYLHDIVNLEIKEIVSACSKILYTDLPVEFTAETKLNTHSVIIDEYYHVYIAQDMILQLQQHYPDLRTLEHPISDSQRAVAGIKKKLDPKYHDIFEILANCCFETTLVRELVEFFNSPGVHPSIKYYVNDHMNDESRHYAFFYDLMTYLWAEIPEEYREAIGTHLAEFTTLYLSVESEKLFNIELLDSFIDDRQQAQKSVEALYAGFEITPDVPIVKNVLRALRNAGMLAHPSVRESFARIGWTV